jgi:hypothetical protein
MNGINASISKKDDVNAEVAEKLRYSQILELLGLLLPLKETGIKITGIMHKTVLAPIKAESRDVAIRLV